MPKVSIITPCYNGAAYIERTIASVRAQTFTDWEYIIVDDGSTDNTASVVVPYTAAEPRLRLVQKPNGGMCSARNSGFNAASMDSQYLLFLDADDCLEPTMLAIMVDYLDSHAGAGLAHCEYIVIDADDRIVDADVSARFRRYVPRGIWMRSLPKSHPETPPISMATLVTPVIISSISLIRRSIYERTPKWDENFGYHAEDTNLYLHIASLSELHYIPRKLVRYRSHGGQASTNWKNCRRQENKLYSTWLYSDWVSPRQRNLIRTAWYFRTGKMLPHFWFSHAMDQLAKGNLLGATICYMRCFKSLSIYVLACIINKPLIG